MIDANRGVEEYDGTKDDKRPVLIVVGGGFAGLCACRKMRKEFHVKLIDCKEYFEYYPGICRAYVHPKEHAKLSRHYQPTCDALRVEFVWGEATSVDADKKEIRVKEVATKAETILRYDYLLVTSGSQYGIDLVHKKRASHGTECLWYPTALQKTIDKSAWDGLDERFMRGRRKHLEAEYMELQKLHNNKETILVIGAGFVGIEFATEVKYYFPDIEVAIVESRDECVGVMPPRCIKYCENYMQKNGIKTIYGAKYTEFLGPECKESDEKCLESTLDKLDDLSGKWGIAIPSRVYMAVGLRPINQFLPEGCLTPGKRGGWIQASEDLAVTRNGEKVDGLFCAGNCAQVKDSKGEVLVLPKNSAPAESMATIACHNIRVAEGRKNPRFGGCFGWCKPKKEKHAHWDFVTGFCATSLGPHDATFVAGSTAKPHSGYTIMTGRLAAWNKEFIRWSKVDQAGNGCLGNLIWKFVH
jgi:NADH dehydrogenase FAD-containing subunit